MFAACAPTSKSMPTPDFASLLQSSCSAPCWNDITPGKTTTPQLVETIPSIPFYKDSIVGWFGDNGQITQNVPDMPDSTAGIIIGDNWAGVRIDIKDSIVSAISVSSILNKSGKFNELNLTIDKALKLYGTPSYILKGGACANFKCQNLYVIYPEQGLLLVAELQDFVSENRIFPPQIRVLPELPIQEVVFFDSSKFGDFPASLEIGNIRCEIESEIPRWQGYTTVDFSKIGSYCN